MRIRTVGKGRRGSVLPLVATGIVGMVALSALSIDVGLVTVARTQCQVAADSAALAGVRALDGSRAATAQSGDAITTADNNYASAYPKALQAATNNSVLGKAITSSNVQVTIGKYYYDNSQAKFIAYPTDPGSVNNSSYNWSLVTSTVSLTNTPHFAAILGSNPYTITAKSTAVHRPRDVAFVMDFSGSMRFGSLMGLDYSGTRTMSNNPDPNYPKFGHYTAATASILQTDSQETISSNTYDAANTTASHTLNHNRIPLVSDFYSSVSGSGTPAFTTAGAGDAVGRVSGDPYLKTNNNSTSTFVATVKDALSSVTGTLTNAHTKDTNFETNGYDWSGFDSTATYPTFLGYTRGPSHWGKTFFIWPPDPRTAGHPGATGDDRNNGRYDWRGRFFLNSSNTPVDDNALLWISDSESSTNKGNWRSPKYSGTTYYKINYRAIFHWLFNDSARNGPNPFPTRLQAGRILYYDALPDASDSTLNTRFWNFNPTSPSGLSTNERFWKDYVDYCLGLSQNGSPSNSSPWQLASSTASPSVVRLTGYGDDFAWGTVKITAKSSLTASASTKPYMHYDDNPRRPLAHFWFGPMTMMDFLGCYNLQGSQSDHRYSWMPGTAHEAPSYACKLGVYSALDDMSNNHPNDMCALIYFSCPRDSATDMVNRFNNVRVPLSRNYSRMQDALFFPQSTLSSYSAAIRPYDSGIVETPKPMGGTCYAMALMLAYNQLSGNPSLQTYNSGGLTGDAGGMGRRGAYRLVIFETDGQPNINATATFTKVAGPSGANHSYFRVRYNSSNPASSEFPTVDSGASATTTSNQITTLAQRICNLESDPTNPGFATPRKPVKIHCIAFGPVFDGSSSARTSALTVLQQIERIGGTQSSSTANAWLPDYKIVTGDDEEVTSKLRTAISTILQDGVQVSLIE